MTTKKIRESRINAAIEGMEKNIKLLPMDWLCKRSGSLRRLCGEFNSLSHKILKSSYDKHRIAYLFEAIIVEISATEDVYDKSEPLYALAEKFIDDEVDLLVGCIFEYEEEFKDSWMYKSTRKKICKFHFSNKEGY